MSSPANPPGPTILGSIGLLAPTQSFACAVTTAYDLTDGTHWKAPCASELYCPTAGNVVAQLAGDAALVTYAVIAGEVLRGAFVLIGATNAVAVTARF